MERSSAVCNLVCSNCTIVSWMNPKVGEAGSCSSAAHRPRSSFNHWRADALPAALPTMPCGSWYSRCPWGEGEESGVKQRMALISSYECAD